MEPQDLNNSGSTSSNAYGGQPSTHGGLAAFQPANYVGPVVAPCPYLPPFRPGLGAGQHLVTSVAASPSSAAVQSAPYQPPMPSSTTPTQSTGQATASVPVPAPIATAPAHLVRASSIGPSPAGPTTSSPSMISTYTPPWSSSSFPKDLNQQQPSSTHALPVVNPLLPHASTTGAAAASPAAAVLGAAYDPIGAATRPEDEAARRASTDGTACHSSITGRVSPGHYPFNPPSSHAATAPTSPDVLGLANGTSVQPGAGSMSTVPLAAKPQTTSASQGLSSRALLPSVAALPLPGHIRPRPLGPLVSGRASAPVIGHVLPLPTRPLAPAQVAIRMPPAVPAALQGVEVSTAASAASPKAASAERAQPALSPEAANEPSAPVTAGQASTGASPPVAPEQLQEQAGMLHELVGGKLDLATCRDVLTQMEGNTERAAHYLLMLSGDADGIGAGAGIGGLGAAIADAAAISGIGAFLEGFQDPDSFPAAPGRGVSADEAATMAAAAADAATFPSGAELAAAAATWPADSAGGDAWLGAGEAGATWDATAALPEAFLSSGLRHEGAGMANGFVPGTGVGAGGAAGEPMAQGIFVPDAPAADLGREAVLAAVQGDCEGGGSAAPGGSELLRFMEAQGADWDDPWLNEAELQSDPLQEKLDEMRIYFPGHEEEQLRNALQAFDGNVQQALQHLGELQEAEYRRVQMEQQAEADAAFARKLAESAASPGGAADSLLHALDTSTGTESAAEDYLVHAVDDIAEQARGMSLETKRPGGEAVGRSQVRQPAGGAGSSAAASRDRVGLKLLAHVFGGNVDEDLLESVLATHSGDVEAARAALRDMGLEEQCQLPASPPPLPHPSSSPHPAYTATAGTDSFTSEPPTDAWSSQPVWGGQDEGEEDEEDELVSRRCRPVASGAGGSGASSFPGGRRSATAYSAAPPGSLVAMRQELPSNAAVFGPPRQYGAYHNPAALNTAAGGPPAMYDDSEVAPGSGAGNHEQQQQQLGPIRLLACVGVDFTSTNYSKEVLEIIRQAFNMTKLRDVIIRGLEPDSVNADATSRERGSLTHEEKQALWRKHRELPLELKNMKNLLQNGIDAIDMQDGASAADKRLCNQLKHAARLLNEAVKTHHQSASSRIFNDINRRLTQSWSTDLHALMPAEALQMLEQALKWLAETMVNTKVNFNWMIITGKGLHSKGDGPKLPAAVDEWLVRRGLGASRCPGHLVVQLDMDVLMQLVAHGFLDASILQGSGGASGPGYTGLATAGR